MRSIAFCDDGSRLNSSLVLDEDGGESLESRWEDGLDSWSRGLLESFDRIHLSDLKFKNGLGEKKNRAGKFYIELLQVSPHMCCRKSNMRRGSSPCLASGSHQNRGTGS